jgi:SHS2 domain-containing protein
VADPMHATTRVPFRFIDHTADVGVQAFGTDPAELFVNAARAMLSLIIDSAAVRGRDHRRIVAEGRDWPDLMVNWLREVLYLWNGEELLADRIRIEHISEGCLDADLTVQPFDPQRHAVAAEIKAVTYHRISVRQALTGWEATIIFDV